jgi:hypothetical protein
MELRPKKAAKVIPKKTPKVSKKQQKLNSIMQTFSLHDLKFMSPFARMYLLKPHDKVFPKVKSDRLEKLKSKLSKLDTKNKSPKKAPLTANSFLRSTFF